MPEGVVHDIAQGVRPPILKGDGQQPSQEHPRHADQVGGEAQQPEFPPQLFHHRPLLGVLQGQQGEPQHGAVDDQVAGDDEHQNLREQDQEPDGKDHVVNPGLFFHGNFAPFRF